MSRMIFKNAVINEVTFPAMDASSKDLAKIVVKLHPEMTRRMIPNNPTAIAVTDAGKTKQMNVSNFRLTIDGLEQATKEVNRFEALSLKVKPSDEIASVHHESILNSCEIEFPNLTFTTAEKGSQPLYNWLQDFVIAGNNGDSKEKNGKLEYLSSDLKEVLFTLNFRHLGLIKVTSDSMDQESIRRAKADMYVESISIK